MGYGQASKGGGEIAGMSDWDHGVGVAVQDEGWREGLGGL